MQRYTGPRPTLGDLQRTLLSVRNLSKTAHTRRATREKFMQFTPYLYFKGDCESALNFYETCGLGRILEIRRFEGTPMAERAGAAWRNKILHSVFEGRWLRLCASDGPDSEPMKGCALLIEDSDPDSAKALFDALSNGGRVTVPFQKQFWGDHYGNFTDKFGVQWAMNSAQR
jgi:PhnB protein